MAWRVATSLEVLLGEVNKAAPGRSKVSDGSIGDAAHATRDSDHNPFIKDASGVGVVRARDFTHDPAGGLDCNRLAKDIAALLGRIPALGDGGYVIWNRRIFSTARKSEGWRPYSGSNPHDHHLHVSVALAQGGYDSDVRWGVLEPEDDMPFTEDELRKIIREEVAAVVDIDEVDEARVENPRNDGPKAWSLGRLLWNIKRKVDALEKASK